MNIRPYFKEFSMGVKNVNFSPVYVYNIPCFYCENYKFIILINKYQKCILNVYNNMVKPQFINTLK